MSSKKEKSNYKFIFVLFFIISFVFFFFKNPNKLSQESSTASKAESTKSPINSKALSTNSSFITSNVKNSNELITPPLSNLTQKQLDAKVLKILLDKNFYNLNQQLDKIKNLSFYEWTRLKFFASRVLLPKIENLQFESKEKKSVWVRFHDHVSFEQIVEWNRLEDFRFLYEGRAKVGSDAFEKISGSHDFELVAQSHLLDFTYLPINLDANTQQEVLQVNSIDYSNHDLEEFHRPLTTLDTSKPETFSDQVAISFTIALSNFGVNPFEHWVTKHNIQFVATFSNHSYVNNYQIPYLPLDKSASLKQFGSDQSCISTNRGVVSIKTDAYCSVFFSNLVSWEDKLIREYGLNFIKFKDYNVTVSKDQWADTLLHIYQYPGIRQVYSKHQSNDPQGNGDLSIRSPQYFWEEYKKSPIINNYKKYNLTLSNDLSLGDSITFDDFFMMNLKSQTQLYTIYFMMDALRQRCNFTDFSQISETILSSLGYKLKATLPNPQLSLLSNTIDQINELESPESCVNILNKQLDIMFER